MILDAGSLAVFVMTARMPVNCTAPLFQVCDRSKIGCVAVRVAPVIVSERLGSSQLVPLMAANAPPLLNCTDSDGLPGTPLMLRMTQPPTAPSSAWLNDST